MKTLLDIYKKHEDNLNALYKKLEQENLYYSCSFPLLMSTWGDSEIPKAMFFGQETNGWVDSESIEGLMEGYRNFELGKSKNTIFWKYLRILSSKLNLEGEYPFLWNNVNKFGRLSSKGRADGAIIKLENEYFNVLSDELDFLKPEICVFLSGPRYDNDLQKKLPDIEFLQIEDYPRREFAMIKSKHLPKLSFRTYHPGYGNRYPEWYNKVLDKIAEKYNKNKQ